MRERLPMRVQQILPAIVVFAVAAVWLGCAENAGAGIIAPQQMDFNADDLAQSLQDGAGAGASSTSSSPNRPNSQRLPLVYNDEQIDPLSWLDSHLPSGGTTSSSTSTSAGGAVSTFVCALGSTIALGDDSPLGQLAEDHGLSLPDPPGTDLLRPPRA